MSFDTLKLQSEGVTVQSTRDKPFTAADARALAVAVGMNVPSNVDAWERHLRRAIESAAVKGLLRIAFSEISPLRMPITPAERHEAAKRIEADGFEVGPYGISWEKS